MRKKIAIAILIIILFINIKSYAFKINPSQYIISQSSIGVALSIKKEEENNIEKEEEQQEEKEEIQEEKEESFIDKILNWIKSLFRNDKEANNE